MTNLFLSFLFTAQFTWLPSAEPVDGYKVHRGSSMILQTPVYTEVIDVGTNLTYFADMPANEYGYFVPTAYKDGHESALGQPQIWIIFPRP
jgi:hypothetical protein